jgi:hypothetical protein
VRDDMEGARRIPAAEAGLISILDVVRGPLWVFLAVGERPGPLAMVGGGPGDGRADLAPGAGPRAGERPRWSDEFAPREGCAGGRFVL